MWRTKYSFLAILTLLVILGCSVPNETTGATPSSSGSTSESSSPLSVDLTMEKAPRLNETVAVTCTVKSRGYDSPGATASIKLPQGAVLVSGNLDWHGDLKADIPIQFSAVIKFVEEGKWTIEAVANDAFNESWWWRGDDYINLDIGTDVGRFIILDSPDFPDQVAKPDPTYQPKPGEIPPEPLPDPKGKGVPTLEE